MENNRNMEILQAYVQGQASLDYAEWESGPRSSDVILAAFPKSGSTWTSYLLHQLRSKGDQEFRDIKDEVVDITPGHWDPKINPFLIEQRYFPRTFNFFDRAEVFSSHVQNPRKLSTLPKWG
jgi:hypothetical protein